MYNNLSIDIGPKAQGRPMSRLPSSFVKFLFSEGVEQKPKRWGRKGKAIRIQTSLPVFFLSVFSLTSPQILWAISHWIKIHRFHILSQDLLISIPWRPSATTISMQNWWVKSSLGFLFDPIPCILSHFHHSDLRFFLATWEPESPVLSCALSRASFLNSRFVIWCLAIKKA